LWRAIKYGSAAFSFKARYRTYAALLLTSHIEVTRLNQDELRSNRVSITPGDFSAETEE
jgi:hypothetical protein